MNSCFSARPRPVALMVALLCSGAATTLAEPAQDPVEGVSPSLTQMAENQLAAPPDATDTSRSTRPGRGGRDMGTRAQPQESPTVQPAMPAEPIPQALTPQPAPPETMESSDLESKPMRESPRTEPGLSDMETFRLEQEQRFRHMEEIQRKAEKEERARRRARLKEMMREHEEAVEMEHKEAVEMQ